MDLEVFDSKRIKQIRILKPCLSIYMNGEICLNKIAAENLNLEAGNTISLVRDKSSPRDWYIMRDPNGLVLREKKPGGILMFISKLVRDQIIDSLNAESKNGRMRFPVSKEPVQFKDKIMYAIITSKQL